MLVSAADRPEVRWKPPPPLENCDRTRSRSTATIEALTIANADILHMPASRKFSGRHHEPASFRTSVRDAVTRFAAGPSPSQALLSRYAGDGCPGYPAAASKARVA